MFKLRIKSLAPITNSCSKPRRLLHSFSKSNAAPTDSLIELCSRNQLSQAFTHHSSLIWSDPNLFSHFFKACIKLRSLSLTQQLHSIAVTSGVSLLKFVSNHLVNAYVKLRELDAAIKLFDRMPHRNIMSYNILIGGYVENDRLFCALDVFEQMGSRNSATWNAVIGGMIKFEFNEEGLGLFANMHVNGFSPDAYTLGSVFRGCAGLKDLTRGKQVHCHVVKLGFEFDLVVGSSMTHMYMKCGSLTDGERVIRFMPYHNVIAFNTLISGKVQNGCAVGALDQYCVMKMAGLRPDKITFVSLICSCSELSTLGQGQQIHAEAIKAGALSAVAVVSSLVSMYSRCGCLDEAVRAFSERREDEYDLVMWSSMISAYGFHGKGKEAIDMFYKMEREGIKANDVTFLSLLYSCSHCGLIDDGLRFFDLMIEKYGLKPQLKHYTCLVDLLGRSGRLVEAERYIRSMPVEPDAITWKTLLSACKIHKSGEMAKRIATEVLKIDPHDSASYVLLANTQACTQQWLDVSKVRKTMRDMKVNKEPGMSWFELKNVIHHFATDDCLHPRSEEINSYLKELIAELKLHGYVPNTGSVMHDMGAEEKEHNLTHHSEKLAVSFALMNTTDGVPIRIMKNLRVCDDCHVAMKYISVVRSREIVLRDYSRFHHFKNGLCSCGDYW